MIKDQQLKYESNSEEILNQISKDGKYIEQNDLIQINYFGDKQDLNNKENTENQDKDKNNYLVGKYKDIYIGCLSINNPESREKFGLNKYNKDLFYIGQWNNNKKEGIGFFKIKQNILYLGQFSNNQLNGFGMLLYKDKGYFYFGTFIEGQMDKGIYYDNENSLFYNGKFKDGKKNDNLCTYFDVSNKNIFIGEVKDDIFIKGYLSLCEIIEEKKDNQILTNFSCDKVIYFDKTDVNNQRYEHHYFFENDFADNLQNAFMEIFEVDLNIRDIHDNYVAFFENLENIIYNDSYTDYIERYNPQDNLNLENSFIKNYNIYYNRFIQSQEKLNLAKYEDIIKGEPKIDKSLKMEFK